MALYDLVEVEALVTTITNTNLRAGLFENIYDLVTAQCATSTFPVSGITVTAAFIDDVDKLPQVVIHPIDVNQEGFTFDKSFSEKEMTVLIDVWTKKNKDKDQICDTLVPALITPSNYAGVSLIGIGESNAFESPNNNKVHLKSITLTFRR